ncbi:MAG TPA: hypothetical protein VIB55_15125 [Longimicrobium sp.]
MLDDFPVAKADHADSQMGECFRASAIPIRLGFVVMHATIHLDRESHGWAVEVQDYAPDGVLPPES